MVSNDFLAVIQRANSQPCDKDLAEQGKAMISDHAYSECFHEAMRTAYAAHAEVGDEDDFGMFATIAMKMQSRMYEHNKSKNKTAIKILDTWKDQDRHPYVVAARWVVDGRADVDRVSPGQKKDFLEKHEQIVRASAANDEKGPK